MCKFTWCMIGHCGFSLPSDAFSVMWYAAILWILETVARTSDT